jgi:hypothetical protein
MFSCGGGKVDDAKLGTVLQLHGDHRQNVFNFLVSEGIAKKTTFGFTVHKSGRGEKVINLRQNFMTTKSV